MRDYEGVNVTLANVVAEIGLNESGHLAHDPIHYARKSDALKRLDNQIEQAVNTHDVTSRGQILDHSRDLIKSLELQLITAARMAGRAYDLAGIERPDWLSGLNGIEKHLSAVYDNPGGAPKTDVPIQAPAPEDGTPAAPADPERANDQQGDDFTPLPEDDDESDEDDEDEGEDTPRTDPYEGTPDTSKQDAPPGTADNPVTAPDETTEPDPSDPAHQPGLPGQPDGTPTDPEHGDAPDLHAFRDQPQGAGTALVSHVQGKEPAPGQYAQRRTRFGKFAGKN